jgi:hypothetical protein
MGTRHVIIPSNNSALESTGLVPQTIYAESKHQPSYKSMQFYEEDFMGPLIASTVKYGPWVVTNIGSPTYAVGTATANHPGVQKATSQASTNTGCSILSSALQIYPAGGEFSEFVFSIGSTTTFGAFMGFYVANSYTRPTVGAWIDISATTLCGYCGTTVTGTTKTITAATWYRARVENNATNDAWTFSLFTAGGVTPIWTSTVIATLPAELVTHGVIQFNTGSSALELLSLDYMNLAVNRTLIR